MKTAGLLLLLCCVATPLAGQRLPDPEPIVRNPAAGRQDTTARTSAAGPFVGATVGSAAGGLAALFLASRGECRYEDCHLDAMVSLVPIGFTLGAATGAHLGGRRRGKFGSVLLASVAGGGAVAAFAVLADAPGFLIVAPVVQILAVTIAEVSTASRRPASDSPAVPGR